MKTDELMSIADSLPLDIKIQLIDKLLNSLNPTLKEIDELWVIEAERRVEEIKTGKVETIPGEEVYQRDKRKAVEMKYSFHPALIIELNEGVDYYEECQKGLGLEFLKEVYASIEAHSSAERETK